LRKILTLAIISLLLISTFSIIAPQVKAESSGETIKVAVLNNPGYWMWGEAFAGMWHNDYLGVIEEWADIDFQFSTITPAEIKAGKLDNYQVLILIDNSPDYDWGIYTGAGKYVRDWWEKGGGLIVLDSSIGFLIHWGILPSKTPTVDIRDVYGHGDGYVWCYNCWERVKITRSHPITEGYTIDIVYSIVQLNTLNQETGEESGSWDDACYMISALPSPEIVLATNARGIHYGYGLEHPDEAVVVAYEPLTGGRVVFITCDNVRDVTLNRMYKNAVKWVAQRIVVEEWSFAIITDLHIGWCYTDYGEQGYSDKGVGQEYWLTNRLNRIVEWIINHKERYKIHFVVILGDIADTAEYSEFLKARDILSRLNDPNKDGDTKDGICYIPIIGNHDVWPYTEANKPCYCHLRYKDQNWTLSDYGDVYFDKVFWKENAINLQKINEIFGNSWKKQYTEFHKLQDTGQMALLQNYVWTYKGFKFLALDFVERKLDSGGPRIYSETRTWLIDNLKGAEPIILFSHHLIGTDVRTYELQEVGDAIRSGVRILANFAGHDHDNDEITATWMYWDYTVSIKGITTEAVCRESTWWHPTAKTGDNIRIVLIHGEEIKDYNIFGNILDETIRVPCFMFRGLSPIDLIVTDPEGITITKELGEIQGMVYSETDIDGDGIIEDIVALQELKIGDYLIEVVPEPNTLPTDTYTLEFIGIDAIISLAYDVQVCNIPIQPYILRSTEKGVIPIIPATVDFDPDTLNLVSKGAWITVYIELPVGHGYNINMINVTSVMLNGEVQAEIKPTAIGDFDSDGIPDLMVKFNRNIVQNILQIGEKVEIIVSGKLVDGRLFEGKDKIRVISSA